MPEPVDSLPPITEEVVNTALSETYNAETKPTPQEFVQSEVVITKGEPTIIVTGDPTSSMAIKDSPSPAEPIVKPVGLGTDTPI